MDMMAIIGGLLGAGGLGAVLSFFTTRAKNNSDNKIAERRIATEQISMSSEILTGHIERLSNEIHSLKREVQGLRRELRESEEYIDELLEGLANGEVPPVPPRKKRDDEDEGEENPGSESK